MAFFVVQGNINLPILPSFCRHSKRRNQEKTMKNQYLHFYENFIASGRLLFDAFWGIVFFFCISYSYTVVQALVQTGITEYGKFYLVLVDFFRFILMYPCHIFVLIIAGNGEPSDFGLIYPFLLAFIGIYMVFASVIVIEIFRLIGGVLIQSILSDLKSPSSDMDSGGKNDTNPDDANESLDDTIQRR